MTVTDQKLKVCVSHREFQESGTGQLLLVQVKIKLICPDTEQAGLYFGNYNIKRHYDTRHASSEVKPTMQVRHQIVI